MKQILKYFLVASILTTGLGALASCNNKSNPSENPNTSIESSSPSTSEQVDERPLYTYKEIGTKTETSVTVTCIINLPQDMDGVYRRVFVEPGNKIKKFAAVIRGYYGSLWYYDRYGTKPFDFENTEVTEDITLYAYNIPREGDPEVFPPEENGEFKLTWKNGLNSSIVGFDNETLPLSANTDEVIKFSLDFNYHADKNVEVKANDTILTPDENGIYSFVVTGNTTITVSDTEIVEQVDEHTYTLKVGSQEYSMIKNESKPTEYMITNVSLNAGDKFVVEVFDGIKTQKFDGALVIEDSQVKVVEYVCSEAGLYSFYYDIERQATWVSGPLVEFTFVSSPEWIVTEQPVIYAWAWMKDQEGSWVEADVKEDGTVSILLPKNMYGIKLLAFDRETFTTPNWDAKIGETPKDIILDPNKLEMDGSKIWAYYFGESEISTFYFIAPESWTVVKYYTWGAGTEAGWPGNEMTLVDSEKRLYKAEIDTGKYMNLIFNNGSEQTVDISLIGVENNTLFEINGKDGDKYNVKTSLYSK